MFDTLYEYLDALGIDINIGLFLGIIGIVVLARIVFWIFGAVGVYKLSKMENIKNPKLAFIPFLYPFALGRIAEKQNNKNGSKPSKYSIWLVLLLILGILFCIAFFAVLLISICLIAQNTMDSLGEEADIVILELIAPLKYVIAIYFVAIALCISYLVLYFFTLWKIFKRYTPNNATLFLVTSIIFRFLSPTVIFMLALRQENCCDSDGFEIVENE